MDFSELKAGDIDPYLGKTIKEIILSSNTFIVFMDDDDVIQWATSGHSECKNFGQIQNDISYWESISNRLFTKQESYDYKSLLAEGYARVLDEGKLENAQKIISQTVERIRRQGKEVLRQKYLMAGLTSSAVIAGLIILTIFFKGFLLNILDRNILEICLSGLMGGMGAFVSSMIRSKNYNPDITISKQIHVIDGVLRIIYGVIAGAIIAIGIKANIIFGFINELNKSIYVTTFLGAIGGASELILPNIIKQIEDKV